MRHIGFFHKRPAEVNHGQHAAQLLSGFADLLKIIVDACYYRRPLNPTWSPVIGYYCYDLFRSVLEADRLHMTLHDMAAASTRRWLPAGAVVTSVQWRGLSAPLSIPAWAARGATQ